MPMAISATWVFAGASPQGSAPEDAGAHDLPQGKYGFSEGLRAGWHIYRIGLTLSGVADCRTLGILLVTGAWEI